MQTDAQNGCAEFVRRYWSEDGNLPKHEKLRQAISTSIVEGYWAPGARLPAELEWVEETPCSLGTVQRALRALVADGLIQRRRGSGTIVANLDQHRRLEDPLHMRFLSANGEAGGYLPVSTRVIARRVMKRKGPWSLALDQGEGQVVKIDRIMSIGEEIEVYNVFYAVADRFPELVDRPIAGLNGTNLKIFISQRYHLPVHRVRQQIRFEATPKWVTSKIVWPQGAPAAVLNAVAYAIQGEAMYYQDYYIPPTTCSLDLGTTIRS